MIKKILGFIVLLFSAQIMYSVNWITAFKNEYGRDVRASSTANHINSVAYQNKGTSTFTLNANSPTIPSSSFPVPWQAQNEELLIFVNGITYSLQEVCCPRAIYIRNKATDGVVKSVNDVGDGVEYKVVIQSNGIPTIQ